MSRDYADKKIKEALHLTRGNAAKARQMVIDWAMDDHKLLKQLAKPHMVGITAHAISHVEKSLSGGQVESQAAPLAAQPRSQEEEDSFGMDILRTIAGGDTAQFGQENYSRPVKKQGASQAHIDAIQQMIKKGRGKA